MTMKLTKRELILSIVGLCQVICLCDAVEVSTPLGKIVGSDHLRTRHGRVIYSFTGIPYGQPPVGNLRFKEPQPVKKWEKPFEATKNGPECPQTNIILCFNSCDNFIGKEDCLNLNVHSPKVDSSAKLPVIFFIHGGFYMMDAAGVGPELLLDRDVVLVDINYRLGALGFMTTGDGAVPANLALKDQLLALKWVHDNIENFGGDPNLITVMGLSSGGNAAHFLLYSPLSKGLMHRGISMSGTGEVAGATIPMKLAKERTKVLAVLCGCPPESTQKLLECMQKVPLEIILKMQSNFQYERFVPKSVFAFVVEEATSKNALLTPDPAEANSTIPWMLGGASSEALYYASRVLAAVENKETDERLLDFILPKALLLDLKYSDDKIPAIYKRIKTFYLGDDGLVNRGNVHKLVEMFSDAWYLSSVVNSASKHKGVTYLYYYDYLASVSFCSISGVGNLTGVCHVDDSLNLLPKNNFFPNRTWSETDIKVSEKMIDLWTNFAKYGEPTINTSAIKWEPLDKKSKTNKYLHITADAFTQKENLLQRRVEFWNSLDSRTIA